jgi:hypothetical protein
MQLKWEQPTWLFPPATHVRQTTNQQHHTGDPVSNALQIHKDAIATSICKSEAESIRPETHGCDSN